MSPTLNILKYSLHTFK